MVRVCCRKRSLSWMSWKEKYGSISCFKCSNGLNPRSNCKKSTMDFKGMGDGEVDGVNVKSQVEDVKSTEEENKNVELNNGHKQMKEEQPIEDKAQTIALPPLDLPPNVPQPKNDDNLLWTSQYLRSNYFIKKAIDALLQLYYKTPEDVRKKGVQISFKPVLCHSVCYCHCYCAPLCCSSYHCSPCYSYRNCLPACQIITPKIEIKIKCGEWSEEICIDPCVDFSKWNSFNVGEVVHTNWFVLNAILKDQWGLGMEEKGKCSCLQSECRNYFIDVIIRQI
eukprot:TRINITY_DN14734_c0_g1_i1.p1 TRINITY_DN14734_c0_g1~~TRINITY_DN14734_c0_g1_i1.p1  ORF type:complete len:280 (+),score=20.22 TRINITY_DN14734_c0_g1_i1:518-1357(+)